MRNITKTFILLSSFEKSEEAKKLALHFQVTASPGLPRPLPHLLGQCPPFPRSSTQLPLLYPNTFPASACTWLWGLALEAEVCVTPAINLGLTLLKFKTWALPSRLGPSIWNYWKNFLQMQYYGHWKQWNLKSFNYCTLYINYQYIVLVLESDLR